LSREPLITELPDSRLKLPDTTAIVFIENRQDSVTENFLALLHTFWVKQENESTYAISWQEIVESREYFQLSLN
jgi:hypothetical protein